MWHFPYKKSLICAHDDQACVVDKPQRKSNVTSAQAADKRGIFRSLGIDYLREHLRRGTEYPSNGEYDLSDQQAS